MLPAVNENDSRDTAPLFHPVRRSGLSLRPAGAAAITSGFAASIGVGSFDSQAEALVGQIQESSSIV